MDQPTAFNVQDIFGEFPLTRFINEYLYRQPFALPGSAGALQSLGSWDVLGEMLSSPDLDMLVVQGGARCDHPDPKDLVETRTLVSNGWTIVVRHCETRHAAIRRVADGFAALFKGPTEVQMFFTPAGGQGFSWHYDAEDVVIVQTAGEKEYLLRKNTVNPWPLLDTLPHDMRYEREVMPLSRVLLGPGDMLYIPCGYWHRATAKGGSNDAAISIAIGVMAPAAIDVLDLLRPLLRESLVWRQRLPLGRDENAQLQRSSILSQLAADFGRQVGDPMLQESLSRMLTDVAMEREDLHLKSTPLAPAEAKARG